MRLMISETPCKAMRKKPTGNSNFTGQRSSPPAFDEASSNAGGLLRWPVKLLLPVGFFLMALQGVSEIIKRIAALEHVIDIEFKYEKPLQ